MAKKNQKNKCKCRKIMKWALIIAGVFVFVALCAYQTMLAYERINERG